MSGKPHPNRPDPEDVHTTPPSAPPETPVPAAPKPSPKPESPGVESPHDFLRRRMRELREEGTKTDD